MLTLLRHPRTGIDPQICCGRFDVPADAAHEQQVFVHTVATLGPQPVVTSPLQRCRRLAERIAAHWGVACRVDARLMELDFGQWEGRRWDDIPRREVDAWAADVLHFAPGGGETLVALGERLAPWLAEVRAGGAPLLAVTHGGPMRALAALIGGHHLADAARLPTPPCGSFQQHAGIGTDDRPR